MKILPMNLTVWVLTFNCWIDMKKNKSLVIILCLIAIIVLFVILTSTIFCLKNVELNFLSNTIVLTNKDAEILETGNFKYGKSIFFVGKAEIKKNLEEKNPYLKVVNIETLFPNKLRVNVVERNELLCLKGFENNQFASFMILDDELKVLTNQSSFSNTKLNPVLVSVENEYAQNFVAGQVYNGDYFELLKQISSELNAYRSNVNLIKANFEEIILNFENADNVKIKMRSGTEIVLKGASTRLSEKFMLGLSTYDSLENKTSSNVVVYENNDGMVVAYYY
ncbi:MAG: cell division protein FtsQ/DivIB [Christensenellales bacterium]